MITRKNDFLEATQTKLLPDEVGVFRGEEYYFARETVTIFRCFLSDVTFLFYIKIVGYTSETLQRWSVFPKIETILWKAYKEIITVPLNQRKSIYKFSLLIMEYNFDYDQVKNNFKIKKHISKKPYN